MIQTFTTIFVLLVFALAAFQTALVVAYCQRKRRWLRQPPGPLRDFFPNVAVVVCLRGADPALPDCLTALRNIAWPTDRLKVHFVFDHESDPAFLQLKKFSERNPSKDVCDWQVHVIARTPETGNSCSLKCTAILTALEKVAPSTDIVALLDADSVVREDWLQQTVAPFADSTVAVVTGNRWFEPADASSISSLARAIWNAAAVVQMDIFEIPWGGSLAIRASAIEQLGWREALSTAFCEDTILPGLIRRTSQTENSALPLTVARPATMVLVNREKISTGSLFRWVRRQLLTVRLHHSHWPAVCAHGLANFIPILGFVLATGFALCGSSVAAWWTIGCVVVLQATNIALLALIWKVNQRLTHDRTRGFLSFGLFRQLSAVAMAQVIHLAATLSALTTRFVTWRQIRYKIGPKRRITMESYQPFRQPHGDESL